MNTDPDVYDEIDQIKLAETEPEFNIDTLTPGSRKVLPFICKNNPSHRWKTRLERRTRRDKKGDHIGNNCPYCAGQRVTLEKSLATLHPLIASEWHPTKNGELKPDQVHTMSTKKVWWLCPKGHDYDMLIECRVRQNQNCPYCSGARLSDLNRLSALFPDLAKEWHPTKNVKTPADYSYGSSYRAWWKCIKGHEWETRIDCRTNESEGSGCPDCVRRNYSKIAVEWLE